MAAAAGRAGRCTAAPWEAPWAGATASSRSCRQFRYVYTLEVLWIWYYLDSDQAASQPYMIRIQSLIHSRAVTSSKLEIGSM